MKLVYICCALFKNGGLKERPFAENAGRGGGCFQSGPSRDKQGIWELKITKKLYFFKTTVFSICPGWKSRTKNCIFLKRGSFGVAYVETVE